MGNTIAVLREDLADSVYASHKSLEHGGYIIGHQGEKDECFLIVPDAQIEAFKSSVGSNGWTIEVDSVRLEYKDLLTISVNTNKTLLAIEGYRDEMPRVEYAFMVRDDNNWYMYCSSYGLVTPLSEETYESLVSRLDEDNVKHERASPR